MEIFLLMTITGLIGLATSVGMMYLSHTSNSHDTSRFNTEGRNEFYRRVKLNASRLK
ncbi:hypothetical protein P1X15_01305 [Runella sp. MFBS21]|uniref:hypothetical protein n=1 Tax=Runella sp. MFBS21 TaxID=3034018 RepID=UPI0023F9C12A|nr:hypothetical protein [Runella sp. MFBS21]MDF7816201.1 hypothetical protein [Runella sp. MFBS21]